jgi:hypothetical protein
LEEVRRTIDRWFFWVSVSGVVYVTPRAGPLDLSDLTDMINRLGIICDDSFPALIAFEFPASSLTPEQWDDAQKMLRQFAIDIKASVRLVSEDATTGTLILFHRNIDRTEQETREADSLNSHSTEKRAISTTG